MSYKLSAKNWFWLIVGITMLLLTMGQQAPQQDMCGDWQGDQDALGEWIDDTNQDQRHPGQPGPQ